MTDPKFSVVVPAYCSERTIGETLSSILAQDERDFELIVVDDGSTDGTAGVIEDFMAADERVRLIRQPNGGTAAARNTGVAAARAKLVSFLDDDDLWLPGYLTGVGAALDAAPQAGFAYVDAYLLDDGLGLIRSKTSFNHYEPMPDVMEPAELLDRLVRINFVMSSATVRASVLAEVGGFDPELRGTDDWDLWLRIARGGYSATHPDEPVLLQRDRPDSQSKDEALMVRNSIATLEKLLAAGELTADEVAVAHGKIDEGRVRLDQIERDAPIQKARRIRRRYLAARLRRMPGDTWRDAPPEVVARSFPDLARSYGRAANSSS